MEVLYWLIAAAVFIIIEIMTLGLTTIWFAGGALIGAITAAFGASIFVQVILFIAVSIVLLVFTRPFAQRYLNGKTVKTNADSLIGKTGIVTSTIDNLQAQGQVTINGLEWTARSTEDRIRIPEKTEVIIRSIAGVKLIVETKQEG